MKKMKLKIIWFIENKNVLKKFLKRVSDYKRKSNENKILILNKRKREGYMKDKLISF